MAFSAHAHGAYEVAVWAPLGVALVSTLVVLLTTGRRPAPLVAAAGAALVLLGAWSLLSTAWGGLPHEAWRAFDQSLLAAAALAAGSALASEHRALVGAAVLAGVTAEAVEVLVRLATGHRPDDWLADRFVQGPVGYHNAQASFFALAVPLALWLAGRPRIWERLAGGASAPVLLGPVLLTQSRAALLALVLAVAVQLVFARSLRLVLLAGLIAGAALALGFALRPVDAALLEGTAGQQLDALRRFGLWTALAVLAVAALATITPPQRVTRALAAVAATLLVATVVVAVAHEGGLHGSAFTFARVVNDEAPAGAPGATRIVSLSLNGRKDAWRVAREVTSEDPIVGAGQGEFAVSWTLDRRLTKLYILQPHSLELELLSELGIVGLMLFGTFVVLAVIALARAPTRPLAAAAVGALAVVVAQASVDWTWSFPALVAPVLLVVGAAAGPGTRKGTAPIAIGVLAVVGVAALVSFAAPYFAEAERANAADIQTDPSRAWDRAETARKLDPWNPATLELEARLAQAMGKLGLAAERYGRAAALSQHPWLERFRQAGVLARAGAEEARRAACRRAIAENPGEESLYGGPCAGDLLVSASPLRTEPAALDGATITGTVYIFATARTTDTEVRFFLDDKRMRRKPRVTEDRSPYDFEGTLPAGPAKPFDTTTIPNGRHTITAAVDLAGGKTQVVTASFVVANR